MTTLVIGAGLIGRLTADLLTARGDSVVLADIRPAPGRDVALCDVSDATALDALVTTRGIRRIIHTAAMLSTGIRENPVRGVQVNVMGTTNVLDCARRHGLGRIVIASSSTVGYTGFATHGPTPIEEDQPLRQISDRPASIYAATKIAAEHLGLLWHDLYGVDTILLRYAAVIGPEPGIPSSVPGRLIAKLTEGARAGTRVALDDRFMAWDGREEFVDARDCAHANLAALDAPAPIQRIYHIAPGTWHTMAEFIDAVRKVFPTLDAEPPPETGRGFAGFPHIRPAPSDTSAAERELGFSCRHSLADMIAAASAPAV